MVRASIKRRLLLSFSFLIALNLVSVSSPITAFAKSKAKPAPAPAASGGQDATSAMRSSNPVAKDSAPEVVQQFEKRLFFKNYPEDNLTNRIGRIEKQIFGQALEASHDERLARLDEILRGKLEEERKAQEAEAYRAGTAGGGAPTRAPAATRPSAQSEEDDMERARMSIQAAREEEIAGLLAEGVELYRHKRGMQAQEKFEQVLRLDPQNAQAHFNLGIIEETMGNFVEALGSYKQAAQKEPENKEYIEAVAAIEKKANAQARVAGKRADLRVLAENANAAWKRGEYISALDLYQQLDQKEPNRALVKYNIGSIYLMLKDQHSALEFYRQAAKLEPGEQKYAKAFSELNAQIKRENQEQEKVQQAATAEWQQAYGQQQQPAAKPAKAPKKPKASKKTASNPNVTAPGSGQFYGSNFAPYAVVGGAQGLPGMPSESQMQQPVGGRPAQQQRAPQSVANGRPSFGVQPNMVNNFVGQRPAQQPGNMMSQPQAGGLMAQFGLIGRPNGEGVTVVNVGIASRASSAGIVPGDDIKAIDGIQVATPADIESVFSRRNPATRIPILIMRNGNLAVINL